MSQRGQRTHLGVERTTSREERNRMNVPSNVKWRIFYMHFCLLVFTSLVVVFLVFTLFWKAQKSWSDVCQRSKVCSERQACLNAASMCRWCRKWSKSATWGASVHLCFIVLVYLDIQTRTYRNIWCSSYSIVLKHRSCFTEIQRIGDAKHLILIDQD